MVEACLNGSVNVSPLPHTCDENSSNQMSFTGEAGDLPDGGTSLGSVPRPVG